MNTVHLAHLTLVGISQMTKVFLMMLLLLFISGCSGLGATYEVPDYYQEKLVRDDYEIGKTYLLVELKCSERADRCESKEMPEWISHRSYKNSYYFE